MWITFLGKHIKPSLAEIVLASIPSQICIYQFCNRLDSLTLCNTRTVTFEHCCSKIGARDLLSCIFMPVICIGYSYKLIVVHLFISRYSLLFVSYFCSLFDSFCFIFIWVLFWLLFKKRKEQFWTWTLFRYFDPVKKIICDYFNIII